MATFKYSGGIRYNDDTKLWKEMLNKERGTSEMTRDFYQSDAFGNSNFTRFSQNQEQRGTRNKTHVSQAMNDQLTASQNVGFYKQDYMKDQINHYSSPAYCIIKPGYRPSMPFPNNDQLQIKKLPSFHPFGIPKNPRGGKDMYRTTFRNTLQSDTPYYKDKMQPFNVKHGIVDPSHTFTQPLYHSSKKTQDLMAYDWKKGQDKDVRRLQHERRETIDYSDDKVLRLPEPRDYYNEPSDPVTDYYKIRNRNRVIMRQKSADKIDLSQFGKTNYLTSPCNGVGVTKQKNYFTDQSVRAILEKSEDSKEKSRYAGVNMQSSRSVDSRQNRAATVEKFKIMKQIIDNERRAQDILHKEMDKLETQNANNKRASDRLS